MYRLIRNTHLIVGLSASLIILMYALSAVQMAHQFARLSTVHIKGIKGVLSCVPRRPHL